MKEGGTCGVGLHGRVGLVCRGTHWWLNPYTAPEKWLLSAPRQQAHSCVHQGIGPHYTYCLRSAFVSDDINSEVITVLHVIVYMCVLAWGRGEVCSGQKIFLGQIYCVFESVLPSCQIGGFANVPIKEGGQRV